MMTGANKFISIKTANHNDFSDEGSGIFFSRQSDGSKELSGLFAHTNTSLGMASRGGLTFHAGGTSTYGAAPERLRITSAGYVGINQTNPVRPLHITGNDGSSGATSGNTDTTIIVDNAGTNGSMIEFLNANNGAGHLMFTDTDATNRGRISYHHNGDYFRFDTSGSEKLRINSNGNIGINYNGTPNATLDIRTDLDPSNGVMCFIRNNTQYGNGAFYGMDVNNVGTWSIGMPDNTNALSFRNGGQGNSGTEYLRIDSSGRLLVNNTSSTSPDGFNHLIQVNSANHEGGITIGRHTANSNGPALIFQKSRSGSATPGNGVVSNGDLLGAIRFYGSDGTDRNSFGANIACEVDGTPGSNDMPGRLIFSTTADGSASSTERLRITSQGAFYIKSPNSNNGDQPGEIQWWNENGAGVMAKIVAHREGSINAPSGLKFYTTQNVDTGANNSQGNITERFFINSEGKFYKGGHHFFPCVQIYEARLSSSVSNSSTGTWQDIKTVATYTPKKIGNRVHVQVICQTWNGAQADGTSDAYARLQHNNGGSYSTFTECDRVQGNFMMDERYHHNPFIMDGWFTTTTTNSTTIKFQGQQAGSLTVAFNWFHSYGGRITIMEYDIT